MIELLVAFAIFAVTVAFLQWRHERERKGVAERDLKERRELLNRIQAPEIAVAEAIEPDFEGPSHVPFDDDKAFQAEVERLTESA